MKMKKNRINGTTRNPGTFVGEIVTAVALLLAFAGHVAAEERPDSINSDGSRQEARSLFERGVSFYSSGQFERALESFQQAYNLQPSAAVRVNIANCYDRMNRPVEAIFNYERFLAEANGNDQQKQSVESVIKKLRRKVCELMIQVTPDGSSVQIDSTQTTQTPILNPIPLTAGKHLIEVSHLNYLPERRQIEVQGGRPMEISFILRQGKASTIPGATPVVQPSQGQTRVPGEQKNAALKKKEPDMMRTGEPERPIAFQATRRPTKPPVGVTAASTPNQEKDGGEPREAR
jgi:hypothetical protein